MLGPGETLNMWVDRFERGFPDVAEALKVWPPSVNRDLLISDFERQGPDQKFMARLYYARYAPASDKKSAERKHLGFRYLQRELERLNVSNLNQYRRLAQQLLDFMPKDEKLVVRELIKLTSQGRNAVLSVMGEAPQPLEFNPAARHEEPARKTVKLPYDRFNERYVMGFEAQHPDVAQALKTWPRGVQENATIGSFLDSATDSPKRDFLVHLYNAHFIPEYDPAGVDDKRRARDYLERLFEEEKSQHSYDLLLLGISRFLASNETESAHFAAFNKALQMAKEDIKKIMYSIQPPDGLEPG